MNIFHDTPNGHFPGITSLNLWYMLFQQKAFIANSESAKHVCCKSHAVSAENYLYLLVSNT